MLYRVGQVNAAAVHARFSERHVQEVARRPDKWTALEVFPVSGLLADKHDLGVGGAFSEHCLGRVFPQGTSATGRGFATQAVKSVIRLAVVG